MTKHYIDSDGRLYEVDRNDHAVGGVEGVLLSEITPDEAKVHRERLRQQEDQERRNQEDQARRNDETRKVKLGEIAAWLKSVNAPAAVYEFFGIKI